MKIHKLTLIVSVATLLGAASPVLADDATGPDDSTGLSTLGIDISSVGGGSEAVRGFLAELAPDTLRGVVGGCRTAVSSPAGYAPAVVGFCQTALNQAPPMRSALGYIAEPRRASVPSPIVQQRDVIPPETVPMGEPPADPFATVDH